MLSYKEYLAELTVKDVVDGTAKFRFPVDKYPQSQFIKIKKIQPYIGTKLLTFSGEAPSFTRNGEAGYNQIIVFKNVEFSEEEPEIDKDKWKYLDEYKVWYKKPGLDDNDIQLRCGCPDQRFRFQYALKLNKALFGNLIKYTKKTNRPPLNPDNIPGVCKHNYNFIKALIQKGYIAED